MRPGLIAAAKDQRSDFDGYTKGSTVICQHCFVPLYQLERSIRPGETASHSIDAYRPISAAEIVRLRLEVPSVAAAMKAWSVDQITAHTQRIDRPKTGSPAVCPSCFHSYIQVLAPSESELDDRAYTWRLVTIPPLSGPLPVRSSRVDL